MTIVHMTENALAQIKSGLSFDAEPHSGSNNHCCGVEMGENKFIGNSDIGDNGEILNSSKYKKVTCEKCIAVLKENGL